MTVLLVEMLFINGGPEFFPLSKGIVLHIFSLLLHTNS